MLSSIFIALLQAVAGDPAAAVVTETPAAAAPESAARTERRRVCHEYGPTVGERLQRRRCRWEEVPVEDTSEPAEAVNDSREGGSPSPAAAPSAAPQ